MTGGGDGGRSSAVGPASQPWALTARDVLVVLQVADGRNLAAERSRLCRRLVRHYAPVLGEVDVLTAAAPQAGAVVAAVTTTGRIASDLPWVWGCPVGATGPAGAGELASALADPAAARGLLGSFVLVGPTATGLRIVTAADLVHTLSRCDGPVGRAWSTRSWAGLLATEAPLRLATERVPEYVLFDQVWGDDELLTGPVLCEEATVIDLGAGRADERSWWPIQERVAPGRPSTGAEIRSLLTGELRRVSRVPELALSLTAGRDSTLVALCLRAAEGSANAYTIGIPGQPDHDGAAATARALGLSHSSVGPATGLHRGLQDAVTASAWTEGLDTAWNSVGPPLGWPADLGQLHLSGSGGEIGRAFYYAQAPAPRTTGDALARLTDLGGHLQERARHALACRLALVVEDAVALTGDAARALDVLYCRNRMRSWLNRAVPPPGAAAVHAAFTGPALVSALLDLPPADRMSGAGFDRALGEDGLLLRAAVRTSPSARQRLAGPLAQHAGSLSGRVPGAHRAHALLRRVAVPPDAVGPRLASAVLRELPGGPEVVSGVLGRQWWDETLALAPLHGWARRQLWNAIAVEALALRVESSPPIP